MVVDKWAIKNNLQFKENKNLQCNMAKFYHGLNEIILIKPTTYMNLSGEAVIAVKNYFKAELSDMLIVYDDLSIELGKIVRSKRERKGLTQIEVANKSSLDRNYIGMIERGERNPSYLSLLKIAIGLGLTVDELLKQ